MRMVIAGAVGFNLATVLFREGYNISLIDVDPANIGPGLSSVGVVENYAQIPMAGKVLLSFCLLLSRLEFYSVLILLVPLTWKR